jgi:hypothetical protein
MKNTYFLIKFIWGQIKMKKKRYTIYSEELEHGEVEVKAKDLDEAREKALELIDIHETSELEEIRNADGDKEWV